MPELGGGLHYYRSAAYFLDDAPDQVPVENMTVATGMTGNFDYPALQDKEGNIWIGTEKGLDRFHISAFSSLPVPPGMHTISVMPGNDGDLWVGSENLPLQHYRDGTFTPTDIPMHTFAMAQDPADGSILAVHAIPAAPSHPPKKALYRLDHSGTTPAGAVEMSRGLPFESAMGTDGRMWLAPDVGAKELAVGAKDGTWTKRPMPARVYNLTRIGDTVWAGLEENQLVDVSDSAPRAYTSKDGLSVGTVKAIASHAGSLWVAGDGGVEVQIRERFRPITLLGNASLRDATGMLFDPDGNLWVHTRLGVFRILAALVREPSQAVAKPLPYRLFDSVDGVSGDPDQALNLPSLKAAPDGRIWVQNSADVMTVDPRSIPKNVVAPIVQILSLSDGEKRYQATSAIQLPKRSRNIEIDYTAALLGVPERAHFRYRLKGFDKQWQDVGRRRQAFYSKLPAGRYEFEVSAANEDGLWSAHNATVAFSISPMFHETVWFILLCVALAFFALWMIYRLRIRQITKQLRIRLDERESVARDIHDTLLQSTQSIAMQLQYLASNGDGQDSNERLHRIADYARSSSAEGRRRLELLRSDQEDDQFPVYELVEEAARVAPTYGVAFEHEVAGPIRPLRVDVGREIRDIVREMLRNAFAHSGAITVHMLIRFDKRGLLARVSDDGRGVDQAILAAGGSQGHWGLPGMRERAARAGGKIEFRNLPASGFRAEVFVPANRAYQGWWDRIRRMWQP